MLNSPNESRSYEHDGAFEVAFIVEEAALRLIAPEMRHNEIAVELR